MNKEFYINIFFLISINLLIKPFFIFGIDRTVQNVVGTETYGVYFSLLSLTYLFGIINDFGIQNFNNRSIAQNPSLLQQYFYNISALKFVLGGIYLLVIFLMAWLWQYDFDVWHILLMLSVNMIIAQFIFYFRSNISGLGMYRRDSVISALDKLLMILICGVLLWSPFFEGKFRIEWFVYAQTLSFLLTAIVAFFMIKNNTSKLNFAIDTQLIFSLVYSAAYRLLDASNMIGFLFAGLLLPMFSKMIKDKIKVLPLVRTSALMIWSGAITVSAICFFFQNEIMDLLYVESTTYWGEVLGVLMMSFIAVSGTYIFGTLLTANGSLNKMNRILVFAVILNVVFNFILIPKYGAWGAAWATVGTQFFAMLSQLILAQREFNWKVNFKEILRVAGFCICTVIIVFIFSKKIEMDWLMQLSASVVSAIGLAFLFKMLDWKSGLELLKNKF